MANSKKAIASQVSIKRAGIFKDAAIDTIKDSTAYDSMLMESNEEYMERLTKSDKEEYDILKLNMQMAESESERAAIRQAMADMRKDRVIKDTENKAFYEKQQKEHNENSRKILNSIFWFLAIGSGVGLGVYYGRPMLMAGKRLTV